MAVELDVPIATAGAHLALLAGVAPDLLGVPGARRRLHFSDLCDQFLRDPEQSLQHHPQLHLRRDHRARHDDRDHHRRHRSVGRLGALPLQHDSGRGHARRLQHRDRHRRCDRHGAARRRRQRRADRLCRHSAVCRDARHAVDRPIAGDGRLQQHRRVPVRPRPRQAPVPRRRRAVCSAFPTRSST